MNQTYELAPWIVSTSNPTAENILIVQNNITKKRFKVKKEDWPNGNIGALSDSARDFLINEKILIGAGTALTALEQNFHHLKHGYATDEQFATFIPTHACHFDCGYCYNKNIREPDGEKRLGAREIADLIIPYYRRSPASKWVFYVIGGGEPLMAADYVAEISTLLLTAAKQERKGFLLSIICNGHLLCGENLALLLKAGLKKVRVTLDPDHDTARPLMNGGATFDKIFKNLQSLPEGVEIHIGSNVPLDKLEQFGVLLERLEPLKSRIVDLSASMIMPPLTGDKPVVGADESTMYGAEHVKLLETVTAMIDKAGFRRKDRFPRIECEAGRDCEKLVINMRGETTVCTGLDGMSDYKTEIKDGKLRGEFEQKVSSDAAWKTHCVKGGKPCPYIPLCHTGCRMISVSQGLGWWTPNCEMLFLDVMTRYEMKKWAEETR